MKQTTYFDDPSSSLFCNKINDKNFYKGIDIIRTIYAFLYLFGAVRNSVLYKPNETINVFDYIKEIIYVKNYIYMSNSLSN